VSIMRISVRSDENLQNVVSVSLVDALFLLARCAAGGRSQHESSP
jgi:hypothetical protein